MNTKIDTFNFSNSSNILRIDYDHLMNVLTVFFRNGTNYQFVKVPVTVCEEFKTAESAGRFFIANVKGKFEFLRKA
jgi:hypothetical protein